ncbi:unnamed protein product [Pleuronectes platessa]|uniref:Uncharacterized protein n=1 Tax=Pleuronectes platessa TaxID=8262 RepID=A0A9N7YIN9_PLEPL|nr:unnamed protein product [Pleuronectes platessa]
MRTDTPPVHRRVPCTQTRPLHTDTPPAHRHAPCRLNIEVHSASNLFQETGGSVELLVLPADAGITCSVRLKEAHWLCGGQVTSGLMKSPDLRSSSVLLWGITMNRRELRTSLISLTSTCWVLSVFTHVLKQRLTPVREVQSLAQGHSGRQMEVRPVVLGHGSGSQMWVRGNEDRQSHSSSSEDPDSHVSSVVSDSKPPGVQATLAA